MSPAPTRKRSRRRASLAALVAGWELAGAGRMGRSAFRAGAVGGGPRVPGDRPEAAGLLGETLGKTSWPTCWPWRSGSAAGC